MATLRLPILGGAVPDTTGRAYFESYAVTATNDRWQHLVLALADPASAEAHGVYGVFDVPENYAGTAKIIVVWSSLATSGANVRYRFSYRAVGGDDAESMDQSSQDETVSVTDADSTTAHRRMVAEITLTSGNFVAGDTVEFQFERLDDSGTDTLAAVAIVHDLLFQYADA
jgi:hypothetical protein